jgi:uncharacterized protein YbjT (DUF2867 family)
MGKCAMNKRALIAGAGGLTGSHLLRLLLASPRYGEVHALTRKPLAIADAKLVVHVIDFDALAQYPSFPAVDDVFCCLGTTIKTAGSQDAFYKVDCTYVVGIARTALARGASHFVVLSAMGASADSRVFYSRVKGEMEVAVSRLGYRGVSIVRPSFLVGERGENRPGERFASAVLKPLAPLVPRKYRPIEVRAVARAMLHFAEQAHAGTEVVESDRLQDFFLAAQ